MGKGLNKHEIKHYAANGVLTICGIFIGGRDILIRNSNELNCHRCRSGLKNAKKCSGFIELPAANQREEERAAHLALKARLAEGISWQEARALIKAHIWRKMEDKAGD